MHTYIHTYFFRTVFYHFYFPLCIFWGDIFLWTDFLPSRLPTWNQHCFSSIPHAFPLKTAPVASHISCLEHCIALLKFLNLGRVLSEGRWNGTTQTPARWYWVRTQESCRSHPRKWYLYKISQILYNKASALCLSENLFFYPVWILHYH